MRITKVRGNASRLIIQVQRQLKINVSEFESIYPKKRLHSSYYSPSTVSLGRDREY